MNSKNIAISVIILVVIVVIIYGFSTGWDFGGDKIKKADVEKVIQSCQSFCDSGNEADWCALDRGVKFGDRRDEGRDRTYTCDFLAGMEDIELTCSIDCNSILESDSEYCLEMGDEYELVEAPFDGGELKCPEETSSVYSIDTTPEAGEERIMLCCKGSLLQEPPAE